ncbi:dickkopf-related protein 1b isoform X1 [Triplophysa rosa]|uniref:dickkopf-related protein 1b isoform X1 n=1 Tax=Triplophysa rosa TaxID=992332 RepID=UPI002545E84F|nr:dickkopf-related protein 1b isoform X1 [Triplophysa rosa]
MLRTAMLSIARLFLLGCITAVSSGSLVLNSNSIKVGSGVASVSLPVSPSPDELPADSGSQNFAIDAPQVRRRTRRLHLFSFCVFGGLTVFVHLQQPLICEGDEECGEYEFCFLSRGVCLQCKKRRKRCIRDAMCCPGNHCSNGVCIPNDPDMIQQIGMEEFASIAYENSTAVLQQPKVAIQGSPQNQMLRGLEGENCLRSSDCAEGLCCARHFWSKICKPVLKEGQVCTKHKRKGTHGLEIFQRCDCAEGLSCRTQSSKSSRSLHTCQLH